jgi:hypothetical protein
MSVQLPKMPHRLLPAVSYESPAGPGNFKNGCRHANNDPQGSAAELMGTELKFIRDFSI